MYSEDMKRDAGLEQTNCVFDAALSLGLKAFWESLEKKSSEFKEVFQKNRNRLKHKYRTDSTLHTYLEVCLVLLYTLHVALKEKMSEFKKTEQKNLKPNEAPPLSPDILSVGQQKTVLSILQFTVVLGLCPHLQPGIGIPIERRSEFGKLLLESSMLTALSGHEHYVSLLQTVWVLMTCLDSPSLGQIILSRHLNDILAALLQLVHGKQTAVDKNKTSPEICIGADHREEKGTAKESGSSGSGSLTPASVVDMVTQKGRMDFTNGTEAEIKKNESDNQFYKTADKVDNKTKDETFVTSSDVQQSKYDGHGPSPSDQWMVDTSFCEESLADLTKKVHPSLLVRELLILQGAPGPSFTKKQSVNRKFALSQSPQWLRKVCGRMLSNILTGPNGVLNIIKGMLGNVPDDSSCGPPDWRKFDAVAKVIATCPSNIESLEEYYQKISTQILQLLHPQDRQIGRGLLRVACTTISSMTAQNTSLAEKYLIQPMCRPLLNSTEYHETSQEKQFIIASEAEIRDCIEGLHKVFIGGVEPCSFLYTSLLPVCQPLFELLCFTRKGPSHLSSSSQELLVSVLKNMDQQLCLSVLKFLLLQDNTDPGVESLKVIHPNLTFAAGGQGGVVLVTRLESDTSEKDYIRVVGAMVDILKPLQQSGITGDFLIFTLQELQRIIHHEISNEVPGPQESFSAPSDSSQTLLDIEDQQHQKLRSYHQKVMVLNVLAQLCEDLGPSCIKSPSQTLRFVQATLERAIQICSQSDDEMTGYFESETLTMAMGLLTAMLSGAVKMNEKDRDDMQILMPLLDTVSKVHSDLTVQEMASDLRIAIATHGAVWSDKLQKKVSKTKDSPEPEDRKAKPLIEELSDKTQSCNISEKTDRSRERNNNKKSELEQAMEEICDPLIPVRGHALITMCRLMKQRDPEAVSKQGMILKIFQENLSHPDSYLYLSSVNGLVAMADIFPDIVIPCLVQEFRGSVSQNTDKSGKLPGQTGGKHGAETRMKVGECLVQTSRNLGDLAPKYRDLLLSAFLVGARDPDPLIRASSMSNVGEVCSVLRFNLGPIIQEVFACCSALLKSDSDAEVRKASAMTLALTLRGLGKSAIQILDSVMRELYQLLKLTLKSEKDEGVQRQIVLAHNELEDIMKEVLFPKQVLQKKIRIRDAEF
ncbi:transport and Golgi organization protein 6 homolog isoform X2 [Magallana gigas]|uniref:transport and Golgi organization protein 6 homolog isoform X2 n=1 Tax=Magallana gigas TaxID=29159 RepID=UPI00333EC20D